ncbi:hypothetical protein ACWZHB_33100 [Nocardia sp. FBN12]|uniref:hypothetical protein n=1 Tax=Nocardia sp. FBN12 TaxID=3419766 RepID=UPI003D090F3B
MRITAHITSNPDLPPAVRDAIADNAQRTIDHNLNQGNQFANGDWVMVDVVPATNPNDADLHLDLSTTPTTELADTVRQHLGLPPQNTPGLTPNDIRQLAADIDRATMTGAHQPSWADQHATTPETPVDTDPTVDLDEIHNNHAEQTPAGISHHRGDPTMGDLPHRVPADPNRFTADTHITPDGHAVVGGQTLTPEQYGDLIRRSDWDGVTPIRLIGCDASTNGFAGRLAQHLGVEVLAPTQAAWTDASGNVFSSSAVTNSDGSRSPRVPPDGQWQSHHAGGTTTAHSTTQPTTYDTGSARDRSAPHSPSPRGDQQQSSDGANSDSASSADDIADVLTAAGRPDLADLLHELLQREANNGNVGGLDGWLSETETRTNDPDQVLDKAAELTELDRLSREIADDPEMRVRFNPGEHGGGRSFDILVERTANGETAVERRVEVERMKDVPTAHTQMVGKATHGADKAETPTPGRVPTAETTVVIPTPPEQGHTVTGANNEKRFHPNGLDYDVYAGGIHRQTRNLLDDLATGFNRNESKVHKYLPNLDAVNIVDEHGNLLGRIVRGTNGWERDNS